MNCYEIWVDLADGANDLELVDAIRAWLDTFVQAGHATTYRIRRRKYGFGPDNLGEFCITIEFEDLAKMDDAFFVAARRTEPNETLHANVYRRVKNYRAALYRDFPDDVRGIS